MNKSHQKKKILSVILAFVITAVSVLSLVSCGKKKYTEYCFDYFDTVTTVIGYADSEEEFMTVYETVTREMEVYHKLCDIYNSYDGIVNLHDVNSLRNGGHSEVAVDKKLIELLEFAKEMYRLTDGSVNVAMGSVTSIWHEYMEKGLSDPENASLPPMDELTRAGEHCKIDDVKINSEKNTVFLADPQMKLDVGAVAKGFAAEKIGELLDDKGISGYVLNFGGNVRTVGSQDDGSPWRVGVEDPDSPDSASYTATLALSGQSLVTSGIYRRSYTVDGVSYHHIIDPKTLMPADRYKSVSIVCKDSALGDALSTALFSMSVEDGKNLISKLEGTEAMWIDTDGNIIKSDSFDEYSAK